MEEKIERFVRGANSVRDLADLFLVADVKNPDLLKLSTIEASLMLQERLGVEAAPVIVVRDSNRLRFLSSVLTGISLGLKSMMLVWGDRYPAAAGTSNVRDFASLGEAIRQAATIRKRARVPTRFFAPVDLGMLGEAKGVGLARERLESGADLLLAQPPTTDPEATFDRHVSLLEEAGLKDRVLLNVFPFKGAKDVRDSERYFGWSLPRSLHDAARRGEPSLLEMEREVIRRTRSEGLPGVYVATRGVPSVARRLLA